MLLLLLLLLLLAQTEDPIASSLMCDISKRMRCGKRSQMLSVLKNGSLLSTVRPGMQMPYCLSEIPSLTKKSVRLLYVDVEREFEGKDQIDLAVDANSLVEEITFDPRIRGGTQELSRTNWVRDQGFKNEVNRSPLYRSIKIVDCADLHSRELNANARPLGGNCAVEGPGVHIPSRHVLTPRRV